MSEVRQHSFHGATPRASQRARSGFTLLELLLVIGILVVLSTIAVGSYINVVRNIELQDNAAQVVFDLRNARSRAMTGEDNTADAVTGPVKWGIRFSNQASDTYEIFSTPTTYADANRNTVETKYFPGSMTLSTPSEGLNKDVIFEKVIGTVALADTVVLASSQGPTSTITITAQGLVY